MNIILEKIEESQNDERKSDFKDLNNYINNKNSNGINDDNNKEDKKEVELINAIDDNNMEENNGSEINNIVKSGEN